MDKIFKNSFNNVINKAISLYKKSINIDFTKEFDFMKKIIKIILKMLLILLVIALLFVLINFIVHTVKNKKEYDYLNSLGYINKSSAGDYNLNIYRVGNKNSKHKLIALSGLGINDYSVQMHFVNEKLKDDYEIIYIDRAGYGYSDDTSTKQTLEQIVSDYRTALKNAGVEGPYVLLPHSIGGVYATYWESVYPEEIEGVVFIDTSELGLDIWNHEEYSVGMFDYLELFASKLGLQRLVLENYYYPLPSYYSKENQKISTYLNTHSAITKASLSEIKEMNNNTNKAYKSIKSNDIPKIYITSKGFRTIDELKEYVKWINDRQKELGMQISQVPSDEILEDNIEELIKWEKEKIKPYTDLLGNTDIILLPGDHMIFEQKPNELAKIIKEFVDDLN